MGDNWETVERQLRDSSETAEIERHLRDNWETVERQLRGNWEITGEPHEN